MIKWMIAAVLAAAALPATAQKNSSVFRKQQVENGLIPYVPVKGFPAWTLKERMRFHKVPGASVAVFSNGRLDWAAGYGWADTVRKIPVTTRTLFSAGSISKLVTAVIALKLVEQGKLSLDSPINQYLRSWKIRDNDFTLRKPPTLRRLLSHTAGTSQSAYFGYLPGKSPLPAVAQILSGDSLAEVNPVVVNSEPDAGFRYSGGGYMIVQQAIMDLTGKAFEQVAEEEVFRPLGMHSTTFAQPLPPALQARAAWGYSAASWYKGMPYVYPQQAAAGLYATPTDLALLLMELQRCRAGVGRLLTKAPMTEMLTPVTIISSGGYLEQMGLGAFLLERSGNLTPEGKYFEHQGANAGFIAFAMGSVEGGNGVVIMMNTGDDFNAFGTELRRAVAGVYRWPGFLPEPVIPAQLPVNLLDEYAGRYRKSADEVITLRREGNWLVETINEGKDIYCFPVAKDTLIFSDFNIKGFFTRDSIGGISGLRNEYQPAGEKMARMRADEFTPSEHLRAGNYAQAKEGFRSMRLNEYQLTYIIYDWLNRKPFNSGATKALLEIAEEQHPGSAIVQARRGDYYRKTGDLTAARAAYESAIAADPGNRELRAALAEIR